MCVFGQSQLHVYSNAKRNRSQEETHTCALLSLPHLIFTSLDFCCYCCFCVLSCSFLKTFDFSTSNRPTDQTTDAVAAATTINNRHCTSIHAQHSTRIPPPVCLSVLSVCHDGAKYLSLKAVSSARNHLSYSSLLFRPRRFVRVDVRVAFFLVHHHHQSICPTKSAPSTPLATRRLYLRHRHQSTTERSTDKPSLRTTTTTKTKNKKNINK